MLPDCHTPDQFCYQHYSTLNKLAPACIHLPASTGQLILNWTIAKGGADENIICK